MKKENKKVFTAVLCSIMVTAVTIGGSLAWLTKKTNVENNTFTLANVSDPTNPAMNARIVETFDATAAVQLVPGNSVQKVVKIENTSANNIDEWVAVKLTFQEGTSRDAADMSKLNELLEIQTAAATKGSGNVFNTTNWIRKNSGALQQEEIFYYNAKLAKDGLTQSLFDKVNILGDATTSEVNEIYTWGGFNIKVSGAAVQGDMSATLVQDVKDELDSLLNN